MAAICVIPLLFPLFFPTTQPTSLSHYTRPPFKCNLLRHLWITQPQCLLQPLQARCGFCCRPLRTLYLAMIAEKSSHGSRTQFVNMIGNGTSIVTRSDSFHTMIILVSGMLTAFFLIDHHGHDHAIQEEKVPVIWYKWTGQFL